MFKLFLASSKHQYETAVSRSCLTLNPILSSCPSYNVAEACLENAIFKYK